MRRQSGKFPPSPAKTLVALIMATLPAHVFEMTGKFTDTGRGRWFYSCLITQVALLVYFETIEWVNLFPWNNIRGGNGQEGLDVALTGAMILMIALTACWFRWGALLAALFYAIWIALQANWWTQYLKGAAPWWQRVYEINFASCIQILPRWGTHLPPDACHIVLQVLILGALISSAVTGFRVRKGSDEAGQ